MTGPIMSGLEAIIPAGLQRQPGAPGQPAELGLREGRSHLDRMLTELVAAGIGSAIIVTTDRLFNPRWLGRALRESTLRLPEDISVDVLVIDGACSVDDLVFSALSHTLTDWVAVASPLHSIAEFTTMSQVIAAARAEGLPAIALAETAWESALQLCQPLCSGAEVTGIRTHAAPDAVVPVFAGRAVFPRARLTETAASPELCVMDYERLIHGLCAEGAPLRACPIPAQVADARFEVFERPATPMPQVRARQRFAAAALM